MNTPATNKPSLATAKKNITLALNAGRLNKLAYIDDTQRVSYGELAGRVQRCGAGLRA